MSESGSRDGATASAETTLCSVSMSESLSRFCTFSASSLSTGPYILLRCRLSYISEVDIQHRKKSTACAEPRTWSRTEREGVGTVSMVTELQQ